MYTILIFLGAALLIAIICNFIYTRKKNLFFSFGGVFGVFALITLTVGLFVFMPIFILSTRDMTHESIKFENYETIEAYEGEVIGIKDNILSLKEDDNNFIFVEISYTDVEKAQSKIGEIVKVEKRSSKNRWLLPLTTGVLV